jgi:superkiller protein 3
MAINTLAGMGILTEDDNLVDAALSEIQSLPIERRQELDPRRDVTYLLVQHHLSQVRSFVYPIAIIAHP